MMSYKATSFLGESNLGCLLFCPVHFLKIIGFIAHIRFHGTGWVVPQVGRHHVG